MTWKSDTGRLSDAFSIAREMSRDLKDGCGIKGFGVIELRSHQDGYGNWRKNPAGLLISAVPFSNLITTVGDEYYAKRGAAGIGTPNLSQPTLVNGMKLGTGTTDPAKSGAGASLGTYESASNNLFDTTHPSLTDETGDTGWTIVYKTSWAAGDVTESALTEAVIVNDAATDATSGAPATISRVEYAATPKGAGDSLAITWGHKFLGA